MKLFRRRSKVVHAGEEAARWKQIDLRYMSEESSASEDPADHITVHHPVWRSKSKYQYISF